MNALSLFSGCLGLDQGLEAVGISSGCFVEIDPDCRKVISAKRPHAKLMPDVHDVGASAGSFTLVAGGFPCQDMSYAGRGAGLAGDRSVLWFEMLRVVEEVKPRLVLVENVPGLLTRGIAVVLHGLASAGYAGRWFALSAAELGACHRRERIFIVAKRVSGALPSFEGPNPTGVFTEEGWLAPQASLFDEPEYVVRLGKRGRWTLGSLYEELALVAIDDDSDAMLLPSPSASESTPTDGYVVEVRDAGVQPDARLYLPGRKWHAQRTLSRIAPVLLADAEEVELLPTPGAWLGRRPENATADPERAASREHDGLRGKRSVELPDALAAAVDCDALLPTPTTQDAANNGGPSQFERNSLPLNAVAARLLAEELLPTPTVADAEGGRTSKGAARPDECGLAGTLKLLPTPVANPDNPGSGGELRAAIEHGPGRRNETGVDSMGRPNAGRPSKKLLPTPAAADGDRSSEQGPRFYAGGGDNPTLLGAARRAEGDATSAWGVYETAIRRWAEVFGWTPPAPTDERSRLSPEFVEWMLGYEPGWTALPGLSRTARLRMLGNSVQVQVGARAGRALLALDDEI